MCGHAAEWAGLPETANADVDDARVACGHGGVIHAQALYYARAETFDEDVGGLDEAEQSFATGLVLQVYDHTALAAVQVAEERLVAPLTFADVSARVTFTRRFDFDDLGAVVRQMRREVRTRQEHRQVQNFEAFEFHRGVLVEARLQPTRRAMSSAL